MPFAYLRRDACQRCLFGNENFGGPQALDLTRQRFLARAFQYAEPAARQLEPRESELLLLAIQRREQRVAARVEKRIVRDRAWRDDAYDLPFDRPCMHEFVLSGRNLRKHGVRTTDVAKRLLDFGVHAPTVYFPLIVEEAIMVEPTETETLRTLDGFAEILLRIAEEAKTEPSIVTGAPWTTPVSRLDEGRAARELVLTWKSATQR